MRILATAVLGVLLIALTLQADVPRVRTRPELPPNEVLQRLGLKKRWHVYVPIEGRRDAVNLAEVLPGQLVLWSYSGSLMTVDAETGALQWLSKFGEPYKALPQAIVGHAHTFYAITGNKLAGFDRATGRLEWKYELTGVPAATPAVSPDQLFVITTTGRVYVFAIPLSQTEGAVAERAVPLPPGPINYGRSPSALTTIREPQQQWTYDPDYRFVQSPVVTDSFVLLSDDSGRLQLFRKDKRSLVDRFEGRAPVTAPLGQMGNAVYAATADREVYAFDLDTGRIQLRWQFTIGGQVPYRPVVIDDELYVSAIGHGLFCLDRHTGDLLWRQPEAERFLAVSQRMVFALSPRGELLLLDRKRGRSVGSWDARGYQLKIPNEVNDRLYLANYDGLVLCLQDADPEHNKPVYHNVPARKAEPEAKAAEPEKKPEPEPPKKPPKPVVEKEDK